jgi:hypothetical protein
VIDARAITAQSETLFQASALVPSLVHSAADTDPFSASVSDPEQFQWDIARVGTADLAFMEESGKMEIVLSYNICRPRDQDLSL